MQRLSYFREKAPLACIKADWCNTVARWLNGMKIIGGEVVHTPDGIVINPFLLSGSGLADASMYSFGFSISENIVTIKAGEITWGKLVFQIEDTEIEITADKQYIGLECSYNSASVIGPSTDLTTFRSDDAAKRVWLYQFNFVSGDPGSASLAKVGKPVGNWEIGSEFAAS